MSFKIKHSPLSHPQSVHATPRSLEEPAEPSDISQAFARITADAKKSSSARRHKVALEAQPYFETHHLMEVMQCLLQSLIKDRPKDPYEYMIRMLENGRAASIAKCREVPVQSFHQPPGQDQCGSDVAMQEPLPRPRDPHEDNPEIWFAQSSRVSVNAEPSLSSLHPPEGWDLALPVATSDSAAPSTQVEDEVGQLKSEMKVLSEKADHLERQFSKVQAESDVIRSIVDRVKAGHSVELEQMQDLLAVTKDAPEVQGAGPPCGLRRRRDALTLHLVATAKARGE
eukprot:CAMPEP_0194479360 /NCGR_PEP_ID=MMETSP0253-20130528/2515_1 /TAXON_ID=2966 /ORGANISM="Noctiluca scintillans" /LENGTH=283 /DNA_ID=CAMNT_0039318577 /DNA_START=415 /DNA_END=1264 /DNA_ORIENTATION=+